MKRVDPVKMLQALQGKKRNAAFAEEIGITPQYLCDLYKGRRPPGPSVLDFLNLERVIRYYPKKG